jgi:hypothetical protein
MKNKSWGKYLLDAYGIFLVLVFIFIHFQFWQAIVWGSYPLILLLKSSPESVIYIEINFGLYGISIICIIVQALILYCAGNAIEKLLRKLPV